MNRLLSAPGFFVMLLAMIGLVGATSTSGQHMHLIIFHGGNATAHWVNLGKLRGADGFAILLQTNAQNEAGGYAGIEISGVSGMTLSQLDHLGFAANVTSNAYGHPAFGAGAPRFTIILSNGVVLFPDPFYCSDVSGTPLNTWASFDVVTDPNCIVYGSTGGPMTWSQVLSAYGDVPISQLFIIQDDSPATVYIRHIVVGDTWLSFPWMNGLNGYCASFITC
jgi:hypothetical protein